jgi:flagellar biosynthesis protein FlhB
VFSILTDIWHGIESIPFWFLGALVEFINALIMVIAGAVIAVLSILPSMPSRPELPDDGVLAMMNWLLPIEGWIGVTVVCLTALITFFVIRWLLSIARFS